MAIVPDFQLEEEQMRLTLQAISEGKQTPEEAVKELSRIVASLLDEVGKLHRRR